jgi:hypothetical protein
MRHRIPMRGALPARVTDVGAPQDAQDHSLDSFQESSPAFAALTPRHKAFFCAYVGEARRSGKAAALRCGYGEGRAKQAGSRIVRREDMLDYLRIGADGEAVLDFSALTRDQAAVIHEVVVDTSAQGKADRKRGRRAFPVRRLKLYDQLQAWDKLGRHLGAFKDAPPAPPQIAVVRLPDVIEDSKEWERIYGPQISRP